MRDGAPARERVFPSRPREARALASPPALTARAAGAVVVVALAVVAVLGAGCGSSANITSLDVTVNSDAALALESVVIVASASGRADVSTTFTPVPASLVWTIRISGVSAALPVSVTATGRSGGHDVVSFTAVATAVPGQSRPVVLTLSASCAGPQAPMCNADQICSDGACIPKPVPPANDGGTGGTGGTDGPPTTVDGGKPMGNPCTQDGECSTGHCADRVCCDKACQAGCNSCLAAETGGLTGTCLPVQEGMSDGTCTAKPESTCKETGVCDGKGACQMQPATVECVAGSCAAGSYTPPSKCNGSGGCVTPAVVDCGRYVCDGTQQCKTTCNVDVDCATGSFCSGPNGQCVTAVCVADGWCWHNPRPHGLPISDIWGPAPNDLWAVAPLGAIAHWDGSVWQGTTSVSSDALLAVHGAGGVVWAVGDGGVIVKWDGLSWRKVTSGTTGTLRAVWAATATDAWAVGPPGVVLRWNGTSWTSTALTGAIDGVAVSGRSATDVWAASDDSVFHFDGQTWTKDATFNTNLFQYSMGITDILVDPTGDLWVAGANDSETGAILHRSSQGWSFVGRTDADSLSILARSPSGRMWQAGIDGGVYTWDPSTGGTPTYVPGLEQGTAGLQNGRLATAIAVFSDTDVFLGGGSSVSHWNGTTLTDTFTGPRDNFFGVSALALPAGGPAGDETFVVGGDVATSTRGVAYESRGGPWNANSAPAAAHPLRGVAQPVFSQAWAVGEALEIYDWSLPTWMTFVAPSTSTDVLTAVDAGSNMMYAVGSRGLIRGYVGGTLNTIPSGTTANLNDVVMIGTTDVWAVGVSATVIHRSGTGAFAGVAVPTAADLNGICANSAQDLWAVGNGGVALHGNGTTWTSAGQGLTATSNLLKVACAGSDVWAIDSFNGRVWHYAGGTWSLSIPESDGFWLPNPGFEDISASSNALWIAGTNGTVLRKSR